MNVSWTNILIKKPDLSSGQCSHIIKQLLAEY